MNDLFEKSLSRRLAQLGSMPVDTASLERALRSQLPEPPSAVARRSWRVLRPFMAVAASLLFMAAIFMGLQGREAQASPPDAMVQMHQRIVLGEVHLMGVDSIADANAAFAGMSNLPSLAQPPEAHLMVCCMQRVGNSDKQVACVLLNEGNVPVTISIGDADAVQTTGTQTLAHSGQIFHVQSFPDPKETLNMVMVDRGRRHVCLIGALPVETLMELSEGVKLQ